MLHSIANKGMRGHERYRFSSTKGRQSLATGSAIRIRSVSIATTCFTAELAEAELDGDSLRRRVRASVDELHAVSHRGVHRQGVEEVAGGQGLPRRGRHAGGARAYSRPHRRRRGRPGAVDAIMHGEAKRAFRADSRTAPCGAQFRCRILRLQRLRCRRRVPAPRARPAAHRLRRYRCAPRRRRVLWLRGRSGPDLRRHPRRRPLPVPGYRRRRGDRHGPGSGHEAQHPYGAGRRRRRVQGCLAAGGGLSRRGRSPSSSLFQCGADSLEGDPITHLCYTEQAHADAAAAPCAALPTSTATGAWSAPAAAATTAAIWPARGRESYSRFANAA